MNERRYHIFRYSNFNGLLLWHTKISGENVRQHYESEYVGYFFLASAENPMNTKRNKHLK